MNILPEDKRLAEVSSNIWGTKFKILGLNLSCVPQHLGQINYKASLLHLQPRQMRLEIMDLREESNDPLNDLIEDVDDLASWLEDDQRSEDSSSMAPDNKNRSMFMSDDEDDLEPSSRDKGLLLS